MEDEVIQEVTWLPTGCDLLDCVFGSGLGYGIPSGKVLNMVGDTQSGKTFIACELIAASYKVWGKKLKWNYDDAENGFTFDTTKLYGVDIDNPGWETYKSHTVEEMEHNYRKFLSSLKSSEIGIYVVDSLDSISSDATEKRGDDRYKALDSGKKFDQGSYQMDIPKYLSQEFFKRMTGLTAKKNCLLLIISQVRENVDPYSFGKFKRSGGKALDFYAYAVLWLATNRKMNRKVRGEERTIGVYVNAKTTKLKTPRPFRSCDFTLLFDYGLDNIGSNVDWLFGYRTETGELREGLTAAWDTENNQPQNLNTVKRFLKDKGYWEDFLNDDDLGSSKPRMLDLMQWIKKNCAEEFAIVFGAQLNRDDMINYVEEKNLQDQLTERVRIAWEEIEQELKVERRPRYGEPANKTI